MQACHCRDEVWEFDLTAQRGQQSTSDLAGVRQGCGKCHAGSPVPPA